MISVRVTGLRETQNRLALAQREMPAMMEQMTRTVSLLTHQALTLMMSVPTGVHPFWGRTSPPGDVLGVRSGMTRRRLSPGGIVTKRGNQWTSFVGSPDEHVAFLEEGGTRIDTSPGGFLRIPTAAAQTAAGVDRFAGMSARNIPGSFILKSKAGNLWIALRAKGKGKPELLYLLKHSVHQRGRHIFKNVADKINEGAAKVAGSQIAAFVARANG